MRLNEQWYQVATSADVEEDAPFAVTVGGAKIGLYRLGDALYALENVCPHAYALLTEGFVEGETVECPLHEAQFHIPSGRCLREPGGRDLQCFPVKEEEGAIYLRL